MTSKTYSVDVRRVHDGRPSRGRTVLVDRVWPRGQRKDEAPWDEWLKTVAPSTELRKWYSHDPDKRDEFARRYRDELDDPERAEAFRRLERLHRNGRLTLMTAAKDVELSQAQVLADMLLDS